jgi:selenocysteine-specific elongation factor
MRSFIVGTAGHIDHGKSALVLALTGTDPDRLKEEKQRGITIDIGFAHLELGEGLVASFIDVPGHERFVRNMLAGAHGIDAALLVVAADESVMPQTREHFHICRLLGIRRGLLALTKCDLADREMQALAELELRELTAGSFLEGVPLVRVSARTGEGMPLLVEALRELARESRPRPADGLLRLPIDRVFTMRGFGTVVTGTLVAGSLVLGEELEVMPAGKRARVRGLQVHGSAASEVSAGSRAAVNLAGVEVAELARGDVLARPGTLRATSMLDVVLELLPGGHALEEQARLRVHVASGEVLARVRLLGRERIEPGATAVAQLRLESPTVAGRSDRLVLRSYSPAATIGGARVLDPLPPKRRAADAPTLARLAALAPEDALAAAALMVAGAGPAGQDVGTLAARVTLPAAAFVDALRSDPRLVVFPTEPPHVLGRDAADALGQSARDVLGTFHAGQPLKPGMPREELRRRAFRSVPAAVADRVLEQLAAAGALRLQPDAVALAGHEVRFTPEEQRARTVLLDAARAAGLAGIETAAVAGASGLGAATLERVARALQGEALLARVGAGRLVHREHLEAIKAELRRRFAPGSKLDVGVVKHMTGLTRKHVIPLLEYLDRERVTRRAGSDRYVLG